MRISARGVASRLTYANVMSTFIAVLVLGGGTAYAADTIFSTDIVDGEVKSVDIGQNQIASGDVRNDNVSGGGLAAIDLAPSSVGGSEVADSSVTSTELSVDSVAFSELAFGTLPNFTYQKQANTATDTVAVKELTVTCDTRGADEVTGGGFVVAAGASGGNVPNVTVVRSYAVSANTWLVRAVATSGTPTWQLTVTANCIS